ncbi:MAG: PilX N-terminal domain-containing pilus assembly protein [Geobacteraceae bacterium]|nr:PilX N-terminal domain-containing pilus assembly protein [Geobacteraceae bacterium]
MIKHVENEKGSALMIAVGFLLLLSILVLILNGSSLFELRSSNDYQESQIAFYSAETGVREGLAWLGNLGAAPENSINIPAFFSNTTTSRVPATSWSTTVKTDSGSYRYYVQHLKDAASADAGGESAKIGTTPTAGSKVHFYRITAEGTSKSGVVRQVQVVTTAKY